MTLTSFVNGLEPDGPFFTSLDRRFDDEMRVDLRWLERPPGENE